VTGGACGRSRPERRFLPGRGAGRRPGAWPVEAALDFMEVLPGPIAAVAADAPAALDAKEAS